MPPLDPHFLLLAAAQMHSEGRLIEPGSDPTIPATVQDRDLPEPKAPPEQYPPSNGQQTGPSMMT